MSETKRTSGEWVYMEETQEVVSVLPIEPKGFVSGVCEVFCNGGDKESQKRNASFICRAVNSHDELVGTVQDLLDYVESDYESKDGSFGDATDTVLKAREIIAKTKENV